MTAKVYRDHWSRNANLFHCRSPHEFLAVAHVISYFGVDFVRNPGPGSLIYRYPTGKALAHSAPEASNAGHGKICRSMSVCAHLLPPEHFENSLQASLLANTNSQELL